MHIYSFPVIPFYVYLGGAKSVLGGAKPKKIFALRANKKSRCMWFLLVFFCPPRPKSWLRLCHSLKEDRFA